MNLDFLIIIFLIIVIVLLIFVLFSSLGSSSENKLYFIEPSDGQVVEKTFVVKFGLKNFGVAPAGYDINNTGHHHLLIDVELPDLNKPIPADANHLHFGGGQTKTLLTLSPGEHKLRLLMGNYLHIPHEKPLISKEITIIVKN